jgi:excisionase family DNA binding protein
MQENVNQPKQAAMAAQFYSVKEMAQILNCSKANVSLLCKRGKIPCVRVGSYPLIGKAYIDGLIAQANGGGRSRMTDAQKKAAIAAAIDTIEKLLETAPDYGEAGITLTFHNGDLRHVSEQCVRNIMWGHK